MTTDDVAASLDRKEEFLRTRRRVALLKAELEELSVVQRTRGFLTAEEGARWRRLRSELDTLVPRRTPGPGPREPHTYPASMRPHTTTATEGQNR